MKICTTFLWSMGIFAAISCSMFGCHNNTYYCEGGYCTTGEDMDGDAAKVCVGFCDRLATCGIISSAEKGDCQSTCGDRYHEAPEATEAGCTCVEQDACREVPDYDCPGAPLPDDGDVPPVGGSSGGGTTCQINHDCGANEDCIAGACLSRCDQSCQCAEGAICVGGYCQANVPPPMSCTVDCDCPQGQSCVNGACG
jgi:hypothetical protein